MSFNLLKLKKPIGYGYSLVPEDVLKTKTVLSELGFYKEPKSGVTPWPDTPMFEGIETFQKKKKLKIDGLMKPGGPTEKSLNKYLGERGKLGKKPKSDTILAAAPAVIPAIIPALPSIPSIIGAIAGMLGLTLSLKGDTKEEEKKKKCDIMHEEDTKKCGEIVAKYGKYAGQRCRQSAMLRYGNCLAGRPIPKLDLSKD